MVIADHPGGSRPLLHHREPLADVGQGNGQAPLALRPPLHECVRSADEADSGRDRAHHHGGTAVHPLVIPSRHITGDTISHTLIPSHGPRDVLLLLPAEAGEPARRRGTPYTEAPSGRMIWGATSAPGAGVDVAVARASATS
jgi:hypothetical protein